MTGDGPDPTNEVVESPSQLSGVRLHWGGPRWTRTTSSAVERLSAAQTRAAKADWPESVASGLGEVSDVR